MSSHLVLPFFKFLQNVTTRTTRTRTTTTTRTTFKLIERDARVKNTSGRRSQWCWILWTWTTLNINQVKTLILTYGPFSRSHRMQICHVTTTRTERSIHALTKGWLHSLLVAEPLSKSQPSRSESLLSHTPKMENTLKNERPRETPRPSAIFFKFQNVEECREEVSGRG